MARVNRHAHAPPRLLTRLWAAPATMVGMVPALGACALGASVRVVDGVIEVAGGKLARWLQPSGFAAITFGHVVLGLSHEALARHRIHEHAHVRQYERWGLLFFPLYLGASALALLQGRRPYWHNHFECQARDAEAAAAHQLSRTH